MDVKLLFISFFIAFGSSMSASINFSKNSVDFSYDFFNKITKSKPNENVFISPISVETASGLAYMGAGGETAEEFVKGLRLGTSEKSTVGTNFQELLDLYKDEKYLKIANKIYTAKGLDVKSEFNEIAKSQFQSEIESVDLEESVAAGTIAKWVEDKTNNKIKNVVSTQDLDADTRLLLVNAIHFKADWEKQFPYAYKLNSHVNETFQEKVMKIIGTFKSGDFDDLKITTFEMNFKDSDFSMLFIFPKEVNGLPAVEEALLEKNLLDISNEMKDDHIGITLRSFRMEFSVDLHDSLYSMEMKKMFADNADFNNLADESLKVSNVVQNVFIEVNDKGTEVSAATVLKMVPLNGKTEVAPPTIITSDNRFIFVIKSKDNIIFIGRNK